MDRKRKFFTTLNKKLKTLYTKHKDRPHVIHQLDMYLDDVLPGLMDEWAMETGMATSTSTSTTNKVDREHKREHKRGQNNNVETPTINKFFTKSPHPTETATKKKRQKKTVKKSPVANKAPATSTPKNKKITKTKSTQALRKKTGGGTLTTSRSATELNSPRTPMEFPTSFRPKTPEILQEMVAKYYYLPTMKIFITCENNAHFRMITEENIWFDIMKKVISVNRKYRFTNKVKKEIFRQIKNKTILDAIPQRRTIQFVQYSFLPILSNLIFNVKYFLIVIGDSVLNKTPSHLIYYMHPETKSFMNAIVNRANDYFKNSIRVCRNMKNKLGEKDFDHICDMRILNFKHNVCNSDIWSSFIKYHFLDFIVVCCYLSNIHKSAEHYLDDCDQKPGIMERIKFTTYYGDEDALFGHFLSTKVKFYDNAHVSTKYKTHDIMFLWKMFIVENNLPYNIIKISTLKKLMYQNIPNAKRKYFINVDSDLLKVGNYFTEFWSETIVVKKPIVASKWKYTYANFAKMLSRWSKNRYQDDLTVTIDMVELLVQHYYLENCTEENSVLLKDQVIYGIYCGEWDKRKDVNIVLRKHKNENPKFNLLNMSGECIKELYRCYETSGVELMMLYDEFKSIVVDKILLRRAKMGL